MQLLRFLHIYSISSWKVVYFCKCRAMVGRFNVPLVWFGWILLLLLVASSIPLKSCLISDKRIQDAEFTLVWTLSFCQNSDSTQGEVSWGCHTCASIALGTWVPRKNWGHLLLTVSCATKWCVVQLQQEWIKDVEFGNGLWSLYLQEVMCISFRDLLWSKLVVQIKSSHGYEPWIYSVNLCRTFLSQQKYLFILIHFHF